MTLNRANPAQRSWCISPFIDGRYERSTSSEEIDNIDPFTEQPLCGMSVGDARDVDLAVTSARRRFENGSWSSLSPARRAAVLHNLADLVIARKEELALLDSLEMGKPISEALNDVGATAPSMLRSCANYAQMLAGEASARSGGLSYSMYEPRGVVGAITPWNFPLANAVIKIAPALAAGNTIVLKPSELAPSSSLKLAELAVEAGAPPGVVNVVPGLGTTVGAALASHADVDFLTFTGSTKTGRAIMGLCAQSNGKPLMLECGGKSPHVVFEDVNVEPVARAVAQGILWNQGQVCSARTRLVVHKDVERALVDRIIVHLKAFRLGDPLDRDTTFGPLASPTQRARVAGYMERGLADGATPLLLGKVHQDGGCFVEPSVFDCSGRDAAIAREEIFGPVLCVQSFATDADALTLANGTEYGLAATVWTRDFSRARRIAHGVRAAEVLVRTSGPEDSPPDPPMGAEPRKASGFGVELGLRGLQAYSCLKTLSVTGN